MAGFETTQTICSSSLLIIIFVLCSFFYTLGVCACVFYHNYQGRSLCVSHELFGHPFKAYIAILLSGGCDGGGFSDLMCVLWGGGVGGCVFVHVCVCVCVCV